jgi:DNA-binding Lrp family transcriptional regulator
MKQDDKITYKEIIVGLHLSPTTLNKDIKYLRELGAIERFGSARNGKWRVLLKV